jgi:6-phosphogluconolactonase
MITGIETFADRDGLAKAAAELLAESLRETGPASLVAAGGGTPGPVYDRLATAPLDWARITVTLTDERWVEADSPDSNAGQIRSRLLTGRAVGARFLPLKTDGASLAASAAEADAALRGLVPFSAVLLGMGEDGHIASLFPGAPGLPSSLDPYGRRYCVDVPEAGLAPYVPRLSLTLAALTHTRRLVILVTGERKRDLIERAIAGDARAGALPVAAALHQSRAPARVLWAP